MRKTLMLFLLLALPITFYAQKGKKDKDKNKTETKPDEKAKKPGLGVGGLKFRSIGPAFNSGRIADIAVNPNNKFQYYVAVASGNVWKTDNAGNTYYPIFEGEGSYSIGCVTIDPSNEHIVWIGTGENNNQRSVAYGDGVYRSADGGKSWKNMGLKESEHIGMIAVHPENSDVVYVAAYGPLWSAGGDRGLYKTIDGGENWEKVLEIDENTGVSEVHFDPRDPEVLYAVSHQRRRHVFTYLGGGPGSAIHKSTDAGKSWKKLGGGLPTGDYVGRIGMDISPANPDYVYAIIEASPEKQGFYRSTDRGASWSKMSGFKTSGNYYQEIICDPYEVDKVFSMNTWLRHTEDGGKTFKWTGEKHKHVDNHTIWIDPDNTEHWIVGCDGGIYETWDHASNWHFKPNLPLTQFYKVAVDNAEPFYNVYGGTQDNNSLGGPSQTFNTAGIVNDDWFVTNGGDGFESQIDPKNPDLVYAQAQYGWLVRFDKKSGERVGIKPMEEEGEPALRWNWDAPLLISPHNNKRLYFAANKVFRSDNQGDDWTAISGDLTRQLDRNSMEVMDRVWSVDAIMKNKSTSIYGNIVAMDESPLKEGLLYVGTDDGLLQISEDGGSSWKKTEKVGTVPERTYVNALVSSKHGQNVVYAVFNNHKNGDFKPYIYKSTDKGATWKSISGDLPERGSVYDIAEDHIDPNLLFAGTEFGVFFSQNGGESWQQLKSGLPTISVRDLEIQQREDDLVLATFGRSFYILDDYSALRLYNKEEDQKKLAVIYPPKTGLMYMERSPLGLSGKSSQGESYFTAPNAPVGVTFTYLFNDTTFMSVKKARQKAEKALIKAEKDVPYPTIEQLHKEDWDEKPYALLTIFDQNGAIRRMKVSPSKGMNRATWDFRHESLVPVELKPKKPGRYGSAPSGALAFPGKYWAQLSKVQGGKVTNLSDSIEFEIKSLNNATLTATDKKALTEFEVKLSKLRRAVRAVAKVHETMTKRVSYVSKAILETPASDLKWLEEVDKLRLRLKEIGIDLYGDGSLSSREFETAPSIFFRVEVTIGNLWYSTSAAPKTADKNYQLAGRKFEQVLKDLEELKKGIINIEEKLHDLGAPYTPGRLDIPDWKME